MLCPIWRPMTTPDCVLLKDNNHALVAKLDLEIKSWAYFCVLLGPCHITKCCLSIPRFIFLLMFCLETPKKHSVPTNFWTEPSLASLLAISFHCTPAWPGTQYNPTVCLVEISFNTFWHCRTKGDVVLAAWSTFRAAWLSGQILIYFSGLSWVAISWMQANIAYTSAWKPVACFPRQMLSLCPILPIDPSPSPNHSPGPICKPDEPFNRRRSPRSSCPFLPSYTKWHYIWVQVEDWLHNVDSHIKYAIRLLKSC